MLSFNLSLLFTVINLIIFYLILKKFLFKPIENIIEKRRQIINDQFSEAQNSRQAAEDALNKYNAALKKASEEGELIKKNCREEARLEYQRIMEDANKKAENIIGKAQSAANEEYIKAVENARREIGALAENAAEKILLEKASSTDENGLYDAFLSKTSHGEEK